MRDVTESWQKEKELKGRLKLLEDKLKLQKMPDAT
jgi:hypothetical protein